MHLNDTLRCNPDRRPVGSAAQTDDRFVAISSKVCNFALSSHAGTVVVVPSTRSHDIHAQDVGKQLAVFFGAGVVKLLEYRQQVLYDEPILEAVVASTQPLKYCFLYKQCTA